LNEVGKTRSIPFRIRAPSSFTSTTSFLIELDQIPFEKGFYLFNGRNFPEYPTDVSALQMVTSSDSISSIQLLQGESKTLHVLWTPVERGSVCEVIHLNLQSAKLEIFLNGVARDPLPGTESGHIEELGNHANLQVKGPTVETPHNTSALEHEVPAATDAMTFEESEVHAKPGTTTKLNVYNTYGVARWEQHYSNIFKIWLNDLFSCHDSRNVRDNFDPNEEWDTAILLFNSPEMKAARYTIETSVKSGRLAMKSDRNVISNVDVQEKLTHLILSYSSRWLQLGLEIVLLFHDDHKHMKITKKSLKNLISQRLLSEPSTVLKYTGGRCKTPSGNFEKELGERVQCHALTKILLLVVFLDAAKEKRILGKDQCLFNKSSSVKSSREVLESISTDCMGVEGLIVKHLERYGIFVYHVQNPLDEYEFSIDNLAVDLKDGVRLAKMIELLSHNSDILSVMRIPTDSRELKCQNMGIVLKTLRGLGVPNISDITSTHIIDGHRPRILQLLWATVSHFRLPSVLPPSRIEREIVRIACLKTRENIKMRYETLALGQRHEEEGEYERIAALLLEWSRIICCQYNVAVKDLMNSFTDGTAFCSLIHFYHPMLLPKKEFLGTKPIVQKISSGVAVVGSSCLKSGEYESQNLSLAKGRVSKLGGIPELFAGIDPFHPQQEKSFVIGISYLFSRLTETREEVVAAFSIQSWYRRSRRLAAFKKKISSARLILNRWRKRKKLYFRNVRKKYGESVSHIDSTYTAIYEGRELVTRIITLTYSAVCIQSFFRGRRVLWEYRSILTQRQSTLQMMRIQRDLEELSSILIQGRWRCFKALFTYRYVRKAIILLQAHYRCYVQRVAYHDVLVRVVKIQGKWRSFRSQKEYTRQLKMIITAQAEIRKFNARKSMIQQSVTKKKISILYGQYLAWRRGKRPQSKFYDNESDFLSIDRSNAIETVSSCKSPFCNMPFLVYLAEFRLLNESRSVQEYGAIQIQRMFRGLIEKVRFHVMRKASTEIQRSWRSFHAQLLFGLDKIDCIVVQSIVRRFLALRIASLRRTSILQIQRATRSHLKRRALRKDSKLKAPNRSLLTIRGAWLASESRKTQHLAAREIHNFHRCNHIRSVFLRKKGSAVFIQSLWRAISCREKFNASRNALILVQSLIRKYLAINKFAKYRLRVIFIQSAYRKHLQQWSLKRIQPRNDLSEKRYQSLWRVQQIHSSLERSRFITYPNHILTHEEFHSYKIQSQSGIIIQKYWRMYFARKLYTVIFSAVISIQVATRRFLAVLNVYNCRSQVIKVQSICRGWLSRKSLRMATHATIVLQSFCKLFRARLVFRNLRKRLIILQAFFRGYQARTAFLKKKRFSICLQKYYRGFITRMGYSSSRNSVISIQAWIRKCIAQKCYCRNSLLIVLTQSIFRGWLCRRGASRRRKSFHAVVKVQSFYRCQRARCQYLHSIKSAAKIQSIIRRFIASKDLKMQIKCAITVQKTWRRYSCRQQYLFEMMDIIFAQSLVRRYLARQNFIKTILGKIYRSDQSNQCFPMPGKASQSPENPISGACTITLDNFSYEASKLNLEKCCHVPIHTPEPTLGQNIGSVEEIKASIIIQKSWRCFTQYISFAVMKFSAVLIQSVVRKHLVQCQNCVHLNGVCRYDCVGRRLVRQRQCSIILKQTFDRGFSSRSNMHESIDITARTHLLRREITNDMSRFQEIAAKEIQRLWRGYRANVEFMLLVMASVKIQSFVRCWLHRRMFSKLNHIKAGSPITTLPDAPQTRSSKTELKGMNGHPEFGLRHFPIVVTSKRPRSNVHHTNNCSGDIKSSHSAVADLIGLQKRALRKSQMAIDVPSTGGVAMRREVSEFSDTFPLYRNSSSTSTGAFDRNVKKYDTFNRHIISNWSDSNTSTDQPHLNNNQGPLITPVGIHYSSRIQHALLGSHAEALQILQSSKNLSDVMKAVRILEESTHESYSCCDEFIKADAHHILLSLALTCNRSEPHLELVRLILAILTNVAQHPPIVQSLATAFAMDALIDLVQRYRDKSVHFVLSASLLNKILSRDYTLRLNYSTTERRKRLQGILMMCRRKAASKINMCHMLFSEGMRSLKNVTDLLDSVSE